MRSYSITVRSDSIRGAFFSFTLRRKTFLSVLAAVSLVVLGLAMLLFGFVLPDYARVAADSARTARLRADNAELEAAIGQSRLSLDHYERKLEKYIAIADKLGYLLDSNDIGAGGYTLEGRGRGERLMDALELVEQRFQMLDNLTFPFEMLPIRFPLEGRFQFTSGYGLRRSPFSKRVEMHKGIDLAAGRWEPIHAAGSGTVLSAGRWRDMGDPGYARLGLFVVIQHGETNYVSIYGHCSEILVKEGQQVKVGQPIARVGSTGWSTAPHLHFAIMQNGNFVDPSFYLLNFDAELLVGDITAGERHGEPEE